MKRIEFEAIFDVLPSPYMVIDAGYRYVAVNRAYEEAVMVERNSLVGRGLFEAFPNEGASGKWLRSSFDRVFETGEPDTLALIPYEIPRPKSKGGGMEQRFWTATHTPILGESGEVEFLIQNTVDVTEIVRLKEANAVPFRAVPSELALLKHAQEVEEAYQETASESAEFRRLFRQAPGMIAVLEGPEQVFTFVNDSFFKFVGERDVIGLPIKAALPELDGQHFLSTIENVFLTGNPAIGDARSLQMQIDPAKPLTEFFIDFACSPVRDANGSVTGVFMQCADRTQFLSAVDRQRHLIDELNHRVKNTLSTVQSMARQSFRNLQDAEDARYAFEARIMALSDAHNVLSSRQWAFADLSVLVAQALSAFDPERTAVSGEEIHISAKSAIALAMVLHELASNAENHGAFTAEGGHLTVEWHTAGTGDDGMLYFTWRETGGLKSGAEFRDGFGIRMMKRIVRGELAGDLNLDMHGDGLECRFGIALADLKHFQAHAA